MPNIRIELTTKAEPIFGKFKELGGFCVSSSLALSAKEAKVAKKTWTKIFSSYFLGFIVLFTISAIKGAVSGIDSKSPQVVRNITSNSSYLTFRCEQGPSFAWDIDDNSLSITDPDSAFFHSNIPNFDPFSLKKTSDVFLAFMGGASASYELNDLRLMLKGTRTWLRKVKRIFGTLAGALSGYTLGHWIGSYWLINCNSKSVKDYVRNEKNWPEIEKTIGSLNLIRAISRIERSGEDIEDIFNKQKVKNNSYIKSLELKISELESMSREQYLNGMKEPKNFLDRFKDSYYRTSSLKTSLFYAKKKQNLMQTSPVQFLSRLANSRKLDFDSSDFEYIEMLKHMDG